ncbi:MAG TPA: 6-carboxytetrahydropterin synthase [Thermoguttaceae bacterium]|jgi:6-pyruvoyltetrahydropterin/6-carboxytetrahydropterin synthase|nr:6-carboxytetrahydropterin synthase [Thermoguttaceae bacterium]HPP52484.1 6-carboxytetrahydropterin synthase [Thermoguttaceae bacterium]
MTAESYSIRVGKEDLCFSACHFLVFGRESAEPMHGHTYRAAVELAGPLTTNSFVADFTWVRDALGKIVRELDHRILLAGQDDRLRIQQEAEEIEVRVGRRRWVLPRSDCLLLPLEATSTELLAQYLGRRLLEAFHIRGDWLPDRLRVELEESPGQEAFYTLRLNRVG